MNSDLFPLIVCCFRKTHCSYIPSFPWLFINPRKQFYQNFKHMSKMENCFCLYIYQMTQSIILIFGFNWFLKVEAIKVLKWIFEIRLFSGLFWLLRNAHFWRVFPTLRSILQSGAFNCICSIWVFGEKIVNDSCMILSNKSFGLCFNKWLFRSNNPLNVSTFGKIFEKYGLI